MNPTNEQMAVINTVKGYAAVNACAGSGKTSTLVKRVNSLSINEKKLILAFNRLAKLDFEKKLKTSDPNVKVQTFHGFCMGQLMSRYRDYGYMDKPNLYEGFLFNIIKLANNIESKSWGDSGLDEDIVKPTEAFLMDHELQKRIDDSVKTISEEKDPIKKDQLEKELNSYIAVKNLRKYMIENFLFTFDMAVRLVAQNLRLIRNSFDHIMVDEFQDVDRFQFMIINELKNGFKVKSFIVVGDPNQCIYGFRGALKDSFSKFSQNFKNAAELYLTKNFRSKENILEYANKFCSPEMSGVRGHDERSVAFKTNFNPVGFLPVGLSDYSNWCILHRTNSSVESTKEILNDANIPVNVLGEKQSAFWNQSHIVMAVKMKEMGIEFLGSDEYQKLILKKKYRDNQDNLSELNQELELVKSKTLDEIYKLKNISNKSNGVVLSTIHKTKGMEWENVMIRQIDDFLMGDTCVYYVAITRARDYLVLDFKENEENEEL